MKNRVFALLSILIVSGVSMSHAGLEIQGAASKSSSSKKIVKSKKSASSKVTVETYPAIEDAMVDDEPIVEIGVKPVPVNAPTTVELDSSSKAKALEERLALLEKKLGSTTTSVASPAPASPISTEVIGSSAAVTAPVAATQTTTKVVAAPKVVNEKFYPVAADKREQVIARLKLVESLIRESGRAYDYRAMTNSQLTAELKTIRAARAASEVKPDGAAPKTAPAPSEDPSHTPGDVLKIIFSE